MLSEKSGLVLNWPMARKDRRAKGQRVPLKTRPGFLLA